MSKELINIISKDDLKTLVNQVYQQKKIYRKSKGLKRCFNVLLNGNFHIFKNAVDTNNCKYFFGGKYGKDFTIGIINCFDLSLEVEIAFVRGSDEINVAVIFRCISCCINQTVGVLIFSSKNTIEEVANAIIELIEKINNKQDLFKLVWSE